MRMDFCARNSYYTVNSTAPCKKFSYYTAILAHYFTRLYIG
jgi:hypothetical protein